MYEWDFATAEGYSVREKCEDLINYIIEIDKKINIISLISSPEVMSIFETATTGFHSTYDSVQVGNMDFVGCTIRKNSNLSVSYFRSSKLIKDEIVALGKNGNAIIKIKNFLLS